VEGLVAHPFLSDGEAVARQARRSEESLLDDDFVLRKSRYQTEDF
jgi:hypothetical protein